MANRGAYIGITREGPTKGCYNFLWPWRVFQLHIIPFLTFELNYVQTLVPLRRRSNLPIYWSMSVVFSLCERRAVLRQCVSSRLCKAMVQIRECLQGPAPPHPKELHLWQGLSAHKQTRPVPLLLAQRPQRSRKRSLSLRSPLFLKPREQSPR